MSNSLIVFLAFFVFLAFGYLSILRLFVKREFGNLGKKSLLESIKNTRVLTSLGSSAFFISMPATSLLLFWGWAPALLWLLFFHFFVESLFHLQYTTTEQDLSLAELLIGSNGKKLAYIESALVQGFFIVLMATIISLLATLIDEKSGLLFALIAFVPAQQVFRNSNANIPLPLTIICSTLILGLGITFAHMLGFSVYGAWSPLQTVTESLSWLSINNTTLVAGILIITSFVLAKKGQFQTDVATFSGATITLLIIAMLIRLAWLQPSLDAPWNASVDSETNLPLFIAFCLFSFAGLSALLIRLLNDETNYSDANTSAICFSRLQMESVIQLFFSILLILSLAAALGIGAWKTHYLEWSNNINFVDHLTLAMKGTLQLVSSSFRTGTLAHTAIMSCMCIAGISFSMMCVSRFKITRHSKGDDSSIYDVMMGAKLPQAIIIFILSCYFIANGIPVSIWLIAGMLSWALIVHLILAITREMPTSSNSSIIYSVLCLFLMATGSIQIIALSINWALDLRYIPAITSSIILLGVWTLWWRGTLELFSRFKQLGTPKNIDIS